MKLSIGMPCCQVEEHVENNIVVDTRQQTFKGRECTLMDAVLANQQTV
jgi:hypothetical protein